MNFQTKRAENQSLEEWREICKKQKAYSKKHTITTQLPFVMNEKVDGKETGKKARVWKDAEIWVNNTSVKNSRESNFIPQKGSANIHGLLDIKNNRKKTRGRNYKFQLKYKTVTTYDKKGKPVYEVIIKCSKPFISSQKLMLIKNDTKPITPSSNTTNTDEV